MAAFETILKSDLQRPVQVTRLNGNLFSADNLGNMITVEVTDNGEPAELTGNVTGYVIRTDGETVVVNGTLDGNRASIVLPASAYVVVGAVSIVIKVGETTVGACTANVYKSTTDKIVDPGHEIPSLAELLQQIADCRTATGSANDAADLANTKAGLANEKAELADSKATAANNAAELANEKAALANEKAELADQKATAANNATTYANTAGSKIDNMTVDAIGLSPGANPTATITEVDGHKHIAFGLVQGSKGNRGKDFHISKTFSSIAAMNAYSGSDLELYDYAMIDTGDVQDPDTGKLYCYEEDHLWHYIGDLSGAQGIKGETGVGIFSVVLNNDYTLTVTLDDNTEFTLGPIRGATGPTGATGETGAVGATPQFSIGTVQGGTGADASITGTPENPVLNLTLPKGETGDTGATPDLSIGTVQTLNAGQNAYVELDETSTPEAPVLNFGIPKGADATISAQTVQYQQGDSPSTIPQGTWLDNIPSITPGKTLWIKLVITWNDNTTSTLYVPARQGVDGSGAIVSITMNGSIVNIDSSGNADLGTVLTQHQDISGKADKVSGATSGNFAALDSNGNLTDSGRKASDFLTEHQDISGKVDKVTGATGGDLPVFDANGNLLDSGAKPSDFLTAHQDISGKADKVTGATGGNFAGLDSNGNLTDSGSKASDFLTSHDITGKADKVTGATSGNFAGLDSNGNLTDSGSKASDFLTAHQDISGKADTQTVAYVETGNTASRSYTAGQYVIWKGTLCSTATDINSGDTLSALTMLPIQNGIGNTLDSKKVDKNQGSANAGKALGINSQGMVEPVPFSGDDFTGATSSTAGVHGYVPAPAAGQQLTYLRGDGTWDNPPGSKPIWIALDTVTNTSGSYTHTTTTELVTAGMKAIQIEVTNPDAFNDEITITVSDGSITLTCASVAGTSGVTVAVQKPLDPSEGDPPAVTSTEFDILANRIGTLGNLTTTEKTNLVGAVNEVKSTLEDNTYSTTGLTPTDCTVDAGGYHKFGKIVIIDVRVVSSAATFSISGFPAYSNLLNKNVVPATIQNVGDTVAENNFAYIARNGAMSCKASANKTYAISAVYLCD